LISLPLLSIYKCKKSLEKLPQNMQQNWKKKKKKKHCVHQVMMLNLYM